MTRLQIRLSDEKQLEKLFKQIDEAAIYNLMTSKSTDVDHVERIAKHLKDSASKQYYAQVEDNNG